LKKEERVSNYAKKLLRLKATILLGGGFETRPYDNFDS
jgi:hypothetical protein